MAGDDEDPDRDAILARRRKLIAIALSGLAGAAGCYESHGRESDDAGPHVVDAGLPTACLSADGGGPMPCLGMVPEDAGPSVCLSAPIDAGEPMPCLDVAPDAGPPDAGEPMPCLLARIGDVASDEDDEA